MDLAKGTPRIPPWAKHVVKAIPPRLARPLARMINVSPDQAEGTISLLTMLHDFKSMHFLTSFEEGPEAFRNLGLAFHRTMEELLEAASRERPTAEVLVLPHGGASFVAWDG